MCTLALHTAFAGQHYSLDSYSDHDELQGATAEVYLHGAHVVSWKDPAGKVRGMQLLLLQQ
jgi:hypothetical protein